MKNNGVFREIPVEKITEANLDHFCQYGWIERDLGGYDWEEYCIISFWSFAQSYYESGEVLFEKFKDAKGDYRVLNSMGMTICFLYRHFVELYIKYLYLKFAQPNENEFKNFLNSGHDLNKLWKATKPILSKKKKKYHCKVDIGLLDKYVLDIHKFDEKSERLRYPVDKKLSPTNYNIRIDIYNLHEKMQELFNAFEAFDNSFPPCEMPDVPIVEITSFLKKYHELKPKIESFLSSLKLDCDLKSTKKDCGNLREQIMDYIKHPKPNPFDSLSNDELILLDTLYYTGENTNFQLYKDPHKASLDAVRQCILNIKSDELEFGKPVNEKIGVTNKRPDLILQFVSKTMSAIDRK